VAPEPAGQSAHLLPSTNQRNLALAAVERAAALKATIFSPEDGTPFPHLPPSMRKGRSRLWRVRETYGNLERNVSVLSSLDYEQTILFCEIDPAAAYISDGHYARGEVVDAGARSLHAAEL
jgi:hypothetical protein